MHVGNRQWDEGSNGLVEGNNGVFSSKEEGQLPKLVSTHHERATKH